MNRKIITATLSTLYIITLTSCYTWWQKTVPMDSDAAQINLEDFLYELPKKTMLDTPDQLLASQGLYKGTVKLRWSQVEDAKSYRIEYAECKPDSNGLYTPPEESDFKVLNKFVSSNTYDHVILSNPGATNEEYNSRYYYRICAESIGTKGFESSPYTSLKNERTNAVGWLLPPPSGLDAWKGKSKTEIKITWNGIKDAKSYIIYRGQSPKGLGMEQIATVRGNQCWYINEMDESEQGTEFYYKVQAVLSSGEVSSDSGLALGYSLLEGAPQPPDSININNGKGNSIDAISIKWAAITPASDCTLTYSIYKTSSIDSSFTLVKQGIPSTTTSYTDTSGIKPGIIYYYYLQSISENTITGVKAKSSFSETGPDSAEPALAFLLSAPSSVEITDSKNAGKLLLRWLPALGAEAPFNNSYTYNIYSDTDQNGAFANIVETNVIVAPNETGWCEYEIDSYPFIKIATENSEGTESKKSITVAPCPEAPVEVTATKTAGGELLTYNPNVNNVYPVKITWKAPAVSEDQLPYGYYIYRSNSPDSSFRKLNDEPVTDNSFAYIDQNETAQGGLYYYYKIVSVNSLGQGKKSNEPKDDTAYRCAGYGALTRDQWFREYNKCVLYSQSKLTLMHKANDMDKLGSETVKGDLCGTFSYKAAIAGLGAEITMHYEDYADSYTCGKKELGYYFHFQGNTDTTSNMSANGNMHESVVCTGMYPGTAGYDLLEIKGGAAGGGYYTVITKDLNGNTLLDKGNVSWTVGEER